MSEHHFTPAQAIRRVNVYWRFARYCYRYANLATHHALGFLVKLFIVVYFLFGTLFLSLRYGVLPNIDYYKSDVEQIASRAVGRPVTISTIYASWKGLRPYLFLGGVAIHDRHGHEALKLPGVAATFSWWSVVFADVRLHSLEISRPDLDIERDASGKLFVGGIFIDPDKPGDGKGLDWVLSQRRIVVRDGSVRWNDAKRNAPELKLDGITLLLRNEWQHHRFALRATPPASFAAPLDVRADFHHPHFARKISDVSQWTGVLYADLQGADLTAWKAYVDYPAGLDVQRGKGAVRAWLDFDRARVANFTADLSLADVSARFKGLQPLNLVGVNGRLSVREEVGKGSGKAAGYDFGTHGHAIALTDFSLKTDDGLVLAPTTISETHTPAAGGKPEQTEITARSLDLAALAKLVGRLPLPREQLQMLNDFAPRGRLKDFSAQWRGTYPDIVSYNVKGEFIGLSLKAQPARPARPRTAQAPAQAAVPAIPGFDNMTGAIDANDRGGVFTLTSAQSRLDLPGYFHVPEMPFEQLKMQANWSFQDNDQLLFEVRRMDFVQDGVAGSVHGKHLMPLVRRQDQPLGTIDFNAHVERLDLARVGRYLPTQTSEDLRRWLTLALAGGSARDVEVKLKGDLARFPFQRDAAGKQHGEFSVKGRIENGVLNYTPDQFSRNGKAPLWPLLEQINGHIAFDGTRMEIRANSARTHNVALSNVSAVIPDLAAQHPLLSIEGNASGPLQELVGYTVDSPVLDWIGHFTEETRATGNAKLALKLQMPLDHLENSRVQGTLQFAGNEVVLQNAMPPLQATTGKLEFNEHGVTLSGVRANFLGGPVAVAGGTQKDGNIVIRAEGSISSAGLRKTFATPATQRIVDRIAGGSRYTAVVSVKKKRPEIVVESSLQGLALDFPAPLRKAANETMPVRFELIGLAPDDNGAARDEMKLSLGSSISARYLRQKTGEKGASWHVVRGGIGVNVPAPVPDDGLIASVNLKSLNIDAWSRLVSSILGAEKPKAGAVQGDGLNLAQYIEPELLAARTTELIVAGKKLDNVVVGASHQKGVWQANIDSEQASGYVTWTDAVPGQAQGKATARLTSLVIPKSATSEVGDLLEGKSPTTQIPALDVVADNFELSGKKLGRLELVASNIAASAMREWRINRLSLLNADGELKATGKWITNRDGDTASNLNYTLHIENAGKLLDRLGFKDVLRGGKGKMEGDISWKGLPFALDTPTLSGQLKLDLGSGQFLKADPGVAKLLGVLSLQALPRRLTLDFRDFFSEGFAFDGMTATAQIAQGVLKTENFKMRGVNGTALMDGTVDIARETQNLHVVVIPEINAGAASVVYGLAVNPVIGVGSFLAQLFLREPLIKAFTYEYRVGGPWREPVVTKVERKNGGASAAPGANGGERAG
ncbi:MAG TPA: YhdP family protein [Paucimonas sp.]|nr:YhdP family protein [Paucimonas sp.]